MPPDFLAAEAGHDINYLALTGLLHGIGPKERPVVPVNYIGDYAGGGMMLAFGMVAALLAVQRGGAGQVIDAAMSDGAALVGALTYGLRAAGAWRDEREANLIDGGDKLWHLSLRYGKSWLSVLSSAIRAICSRYWLYHGTRAGNRSPRDRYAQPRRCAAHFAVTMPAHPVLNRRGAVHPHNTRCGPSSTLDGYSGAPAHAIPKPRSIGQPRRARGRMRAILSELALAPTKSPR